MFQKKEKPLKVLDVKPKHQGAFMSSETTASSSSKQQKIRIGGNSPSNDAKSTVAQGMPYIANVTIQGASDFLFHRWSCDAIAEKSKASKGSKFKKTDDIETYVYRNEDGFLCIPGEYLRQSIIHAAKFRQDPRSPRKSAMDLYKASIISLTLMASVGIKDWDYEDRRRVVIQRAAITRVRPALKAGWKAKFQLMCNLPEYVDPQALLETIQSAGKLVGMGDFRPTYGRFNTIFYEID